MFRMPRYLHVEEREINSFLEANGIDYLETQVVNAAINACARGPVGLVIEPTNLELVLTVSSKISPALQRLSIQCGGADIAIRLLQKLGAAVSVYALRFAMSQ